MSRAVSMASGCGSALCLGKKTSIFKPPVSLATNDLILRESIFGHGGCAQRINEIEHNKGEHTVPQVFHVVQP